MKLLDISLRRVNLFISEINKLLKIEFPYNDSKEALSSIRDHFFTHKNNLSIASRRGQDVIEQACTVTLNDLFIYLPLLGFILRSTNIRNSFVSSIACRPLTIIAGTS